MRTKQQLIWSEGGNWKDTKCHGQLLSAFLVFVSVPDAELSTADETEAKGGGRRLLTHTACRSCTPQDENPISFFFLHNIPIIIIKNLTYHIMYQIR